MTGKLISTRDTEKKEISYTDALLEGLAPDGGLYVPTEYSKITLDELKEWKNLKYYELAFEVKKKLIGNFIPEKELKLMLKESYSEPKFSSQNNVTVPVNKIEDNLFIQNLSLGPTAAFKDMALQQLGQEMDFVLKQRNEKLIILGATSGDTGSSAEAAIKGLNNITLFMLSPKVGMSDFQRAQMGNLTGENIFNISVEGRFDDCQDLVKALKKDPEFSKLGAVNSINWGRISSQIPYYVSGYLQTVENIGDEVDFAVPSGNFGNVLAGYFAKQMGLPIRRLIVATNENNVLDKLMKTGIYELTPAQITSSPSMDISKASNYERLVFDIFEKDASKVLKYMKEFTEKGKVDFADFGIDKSIFSQIGFYSGSSTHQDRLNIIKEVYDKSKIMIETHTADGVFVGKQFKENIPMICMQTAMPVKFEQTIKEALGFIPEREERFKDIENLNEDSFHIIQISEDQLKGYIRKNI